MRSFLGTITLTLVLAALLLEILLRVFSLASHVPEEVNLDGDRMYKPGLEARFTAGGMGEIRGRYHINAQGWNSLLDYGAVYTAEVDSGVPASDSTQVRIAIIGDSYIEGMQGDVGSSVGRILEELWTCGQTKGPEGLRTSGHADGPVEGPSACVVHEYGKAGGNITDHALVYEKWVRGRYDYVFVLVTDDDLVQQAPWYMGRGAAYKGVSGARRIYYASAFLRYLGLNHKLGMRLKGMLNEQVFGRPVWRRLFGPGTVSVEMPSGVNRDATDRFGGEVVFLYEPGKVDSAFRQAYPCLEIRHALKPYNFGFDGHWNLNGRTNCAVCIRDYILRP